jgi:hypothetical protein
MIKTIPKNKKKPNRSKLVKKLDNIFSKFIRLREIDHNGFTTCFTCGKKDHWKKLQNGHFQSRRHYATRWHEQNCQVQCVGCNMFKGGEQFLFAKQLDEKYYIGISDELYIAAQSIVKFTNEEILLLIKKYEKIVNEIN